MPGSDLEYQVQIGFWQSIKGGTVSDIPGTAELVLQKEAAEQQTTYR